MNRGFTLIETIIYIALFTLLVGTVFISAYQIIENSQKLSDKTVMQNEANFVLRKISWVVTGAQTIHTPSAQNTTNLKITKYDGTKIEICLDENIIKIHEGNFRSCDDSEYLALTTDNISVSSLLFELIPGVGSGPAGIKATITITENNTEFPFTITKHLRK